MRESAAESDVAADSRVALLPDRRTRRCSNAVPVTETMPLSESGSIAADYTHPSWNFRSLIPALNGGKYPLLTRALLSAPVTVTLNGGGAAYLRFSVAANLSAIIGATSSGQPVPSAVDFILVRTQ